MQNVLPIIMFHLPRLNTLIRTGSSTMANLLFFAGFLGCCMLFVVMLRHISIRSGWPKVAEHYRSPERITDGNDVTIVMNTITCPTTLTKKNETLYVSAYLSFSLFLPA